ncbi:GerMN domain-containing protein [Kutzneria kofuensis]|uniref:GerMN domain-containing protein n=1 Tax=Kutzneria kofuensis TaxID=103725 RepID=A0A7W9KJP0_9PSEU|nr:hypothetical protein [Kutzneria kofuensis]MBB5893680.1 hypothetical protein [Kutzneria kofuensis]
MTRRHGLLSAATLLLVGALVGAVVAGCGIRPSRVIQGWEAPKGAVSSLIVYLLDHGTLRAVTRPLPPSPTLDPKATAGMIIRSPQDDALRALAQGPTATEAAGGLTSDIPSDATLATKYVDDGGNWVFVYTPDGKPLTQHAVDQIVCTFVSSITNNGGGDSKQIKVRVLDTGKKPWPSQSCPVATP